MAAEDYRVLNRLEHMTAVAGGPWRVTSTPCVLPKVSLGGANLRRTFVAVAAHGQGVGSRSTTKASRREAGDLDARYCREQAKAGSPAYFV